VELEEKVLSNVKTLIVPYVEKLKGTLPHSSNKNYVSIVETNINKIVSPFSHKLSSNHFGLSHREIQVANLIKEGYQSKEIAEMLQISFETVNDYRRIIRKKLGIKNKKVNLKVNLLSLSD